MATWWVNSQTGTFHQGDQQPGDVAATPEQLSAYQASLVTLGAVQDECARRINLAVSDNQKLNMLGTMAAIEASITLLGQTATTQQQATAQSFVASMQWIAAMKGVCAGLVGNLNYQEDSNWPALDPSVAAFAAQF